MPDGWMTRFNDPISREALDAYQLHMLNQQMEYAVANSGFYRERLGGIRLPLGSLEELGTLSFTHADDILQHGTDMLCIGGDQVERVVSVQSSGSSGQAKRIYFSKADLDYTIQLYEEGMHYLCRPGDEVFIFMPAATENSIGRLLGEGVKRLGAIPVVIGIPQDEAKAVEALRKGKPYSLVGIPSQIRKLALLAPEIRPSTVLLSADYISHSTKDTIATKWECKVFEHYGLTETAYGCAVECPALQGQHIRYDDLLVEIVEVDGDASLPGGMWGEIVITTLRREAMPLIRYRTGDMGRLLEGRCSCGIALPRLDRVLGRIAELNKEITIYALDELLLQNDAILDFQAVMDQGVLIIEIEADSPEGERICMDLVKEKWPALSVQVKKADIAPLGRNSKRGILRT